MIEDANTVSMRIVICLKNYNGGHHSLLVVKNLPADTGDSRDINLIPGLGKIPWRRKWQPAQIFLPGKSHRPRSIWIFFETLSWKYLGLFFKLWDGSQNQIRESACTDKITILNLKKVWNPFIMAHWASSTLFLNRKETFLIAMIQRGY